uniref:Uncharacterized protein n=1 Tax=Arundo donax TaxID=35708 RepID=A0A0A9DD01_ARUDO
MIPPPITFPEKSTTLLFSFQRRMQAITYSDVTVAKAAPLTPRPSGKTNIASSITFTRLPIPTAYKGVFVSMSPRNAPCAASATTIGGAPYALNVRNCSAGIRIGESIGTPITSISVPDPKISATVSISPIPAAKAKDDDTAGRYFLLLVNLSGDLGNSHLSPFPE